MKNDETYTKNNYKDKSKLTPLKSNENILQSDSNLGNNVLKSQILISPRAIEVNGKINSKVKENQEINSNYNSSKLFDIKSSMNNSTKNLINIKNKPNMINNNIPPLYVNSNQVNNVNSDSNNNTKSNNFNFTGTNGDSQANKSLTNETFRNLFKLNSELNIYLEPNKSTRLNNFDHNKNPHKVSKSLFSHRIRDTKNTLTNTNPNTKTYFNNNLNYTNNLSPKNTTSYFNKTSKLRKSCYQKFQPESEMFNLDMYNSLVTETMGNYRIESFPVHLNVENNEDILPPHNRTLGFPASNKTLIGKSNNNLNITYGDKAFIKINVTDKEYVNPVDSLKILDTNKDIFHNISNSLVNIQKMYYDNTIHEIEKFNDFKKNMCKVRVSNIMPKNTDFLMLFKHKDTLIGEKNPNLIVSGATQSSSNLSSLLKNNLASKGSLNEGTSSSNPNKERSAESIEKEKILEKHREKERERERERENRRDKKKKNEIKFKNKIMRPDEMELYAFYKYSSKNFPEGREQFAFNYNLSEIVLFGGIVTNKNNHVWTLDPISLEWDKKNTDNIPPYPRYGHSGIVHQKRIYIFGGKCKSNNYHYIADLDIFDLTDSQWLTPNFSSKVSLELRRNHVADLIGNQMIIHGGFNEENKILSDAHVLSLSPLKWNSLNISEFTPGPALSGHASAVVLPMEIRYNQKTSLYKFPENLFGKIVTNRMREKGWYLFGGINSDEGTITNDLWILRLGRKPLEWIKPNVRGKPPLPRYAHTLNYYEEGNFLICHGGRNDLSSQSFALNDTHIFDLSKMEWQEIKLYSDMENFNVYNRCGHNSVIFTNKLIIFGGMNNMNYLGSSLFILNLDFNYKFQKEAEHENSFDSHDKTKGKGVKNKKNQYNDCHDKNEIEKVFLPPIK